MAAKGRCSAFGHDDPMEELSSGGPIPQLLEHYSSQDSGSSSHVVPI